MVKVRRPARRRPAVETSTYRRDVEVDWDGRGFILGHPGQRLAGVGSEAAASKAMKDGRLLPVWVGTKSVGTVRVVVGELLPQEESEWVGRLKGRLRLESGRLAFMDHEIEVPPGDYRARVFCYLPAAVHFDFVRSGRVLGDEPQPLGAYFRRTRPGRRMPLWLQAGLADGWMSDPGHEKTWAGMSASKTRALRLAFEKVRYVEVLVQLIPGATAPDLALSPIESTPGSGMWVPCWEARQPTVCPLGIECAPVPLDED